PTAADLAGLSLHPDDDLAPNRPGEALHSELAADAGRAHRFRSDPRRAALAAQQLIGEELERLEGIGWRVLHSVPLPGAAYLSHLLIGPGGVLSVRTLHGGNGKQRVKIADPLVQVGRSEPLPHLRWARREAERATFALATAVRPVLALAGAGRVDPAPLLRDVRILREREVPELAGAGGVLKPTDVEALYASARDRRTWLRA
ncbi:MAG TPA: nuclease-related domain-containing protein, partial [Streptomyces sp.]|nr:nuclease-related domain-containing protein [Streptomyces sp.]